MPVRAAEQSTMARRTGKRKAVDAPGRPRAEIAEPAAEPDDWEDPGEDNSRLEEGEMEILLTGHAATHGIEGEDNWLIKTEEESWGERS